MRKIKKLLSVLLATSLVLSLAACGKSDSGEANATSTPAPTKEAEATAAPTEAAGPDISEKVDLVFYVMGDAPKDEAVVEDAINEVLLKKLNATVDFQFSTWTDWTQKYNLELTSGTADLIYSANWINYAQLSNSGAYAELDDMLATYAPNITANMDPALLEQCKVGGKLYAIPNTWPEYTVSGLSYREDLREKYNLPVPNSLDNFEAFLLGVKQNDPNQGLLTVTTSESSGLGFAFDAMNIVLLKYPWVGILPYGLAADYDTPSDVYDYWYSDDFVTDVKLMKKYADEGFWSRSALSDTNDSEAYNNGLCVSVVAGQNPNKNITAVNAFAKDHPEWKSEYVAYGEVTNTIYPAHATQNLTCVVGNSKHKERALMVLDLMLYDQELNDLVQYGIKGTHYEVDANGIYRNLSENFMYEGFNTWNLRNGDIKLSQETDVLLQSMFDKYAGLAANTKFPGVNILGGFAEDYSKYEVERSAVSDVMRQYLAPIQAGLVTDVDKAVAEFKTKVEAAGLDACREGYKTQWLAYCEEHNYK